KLRPFTVGHARRHAVWPRDAIHGGYIDRQRAEARMTKVFVPCDSAAVSVGADAVAEAIHKLSPEATLVRNGSRGMFWLEPLVEVETPRGRVAYGPVTPEIVPQLLAAGMLEGKPHHLCLGLTEEIDFLKKQERLTFARCGITDPLSIEDYVAHGGF